MKEKEILEYSVKFLGEEVACLKDAMKRARKTLRILSKMNGSLKFKFIIVIRSLWKSDGGKDVERRPEKECSLEEALLSAIEKFEKINHEDVSFRYASVYISLPNNIAVLLPREIWLGIAEDILKKKNRRRGK